MGWGLGLPVQEGNSQEDHKCRCLAFRSLPCPADGLSDKYILSGNSSFSGTVPLSKFFQIVKLEGKVVPELTKS